MHGPRAGTKEIHHRLEDAFEIEYMFQNGATDNEVELLAAEIPGQLFGRRDQGLYARLVENKTVVGKPQGVRQPRSLGLGLQRPRTAAGRPWFRPQRSALTRNDPCRRRAAPRVG